MLDAAHAQLSKAAEALGASRSTLRNATSSHHIKNPASFTALDAFYTQVTKPEGIRGAQLFLGSLDGELLLSARLRTDPAPSGRKKKRARDDAADRAAQAMKSVRKRCASDDSLKKATLDFAERTIEQLLRSVKGPGDEELFESCGLSVAPVQTATASAATVAPVANASAGPKRPRLIIACRLSAGVALPLGALRGALGPCFKDGMITTRPESLGAEYQLPLTDAGRVVEAQGQRSMLLFAAVPEQP